MVAWNEDTLALKLLPAFVAVDFFAHVVYYNLGSSGVQLISPRSRFQTSSGDKPAFFVHNEALPSGCIPNLLANRCKAKPYTAFKD